LGLSNLKPFPLKYAPLLVAGFFVSGKVKPENIYVYPKFAKEIAEIFWGFGRECLEILVNGR
jgi:hypothetical protein